jgi:hypothetical protein
MLAIGPPRPRRLLAGALVAAVVAGGALAWLLSGSDDDGPLFGIVSDNSRDAGVSAKLGARVTRIAYPIGTRPPAMREVVAAHAERGVQLLLLAEFPRGELPDSAAARGLANWAREFGPGGRFWTGREDDHLAVRYIEFGNESAYPHGGVADRAGEYAERARDAAAALERTGGDERVGLLVQADDADTENGWVNAMFEAVPDLGRRVAGWTLHPYGPAYRARIRRLVAQTRAAGAPDSVPIFLTEWGVASAGGACVEPDNYGWDPCMDFEEAASTLRKVVAGVERELGDRLGGFFVYSGRDLRAASQSAEREHFFGALTLDERPKGAYAEAVRALLERSPEP